MSLTFSFRFGPTLFHARRIAKRTAGHRSWASRRSPDSPGQKDAFTTLLARHHYLGPAPLIGQSIQYLACVQDRWLALLVVAAAALKSRPRDQWIGCPPVFTGHASIDWPTTPGFSSCRAVRKRISPRQSCRFTRNGSRPIGTDATAIPCSSLRPSSILARPLLAQPYQKEDAPQMRLNTKQTDSLFPYVVQLTDPRKLHGQQHPRRALTAIMFCASGCGARGYEASSDWAQQLSQTMRKRLGCTKRGGRYIIPSRSTL